MKLCSVTSLMKYYPLPEALRVIAEAGYEGVELWGGFPHAYTDDFYEDGWLSEPTVARARKLIEASGLTPVSFLPEQCFYPVNFLVTEAPPFDGERLRTRSVTYFKRAITVAAALGFPNMTVTTPFWGWKQTAGGFARSNDKDLGRVIDTFGDLARVAERAGVTMILEPLTFLETTAVETLDDLTTVLDGVGSNALAAMIDTGHINVSATALAKDPADYFAEHVSRLGPALRHIHIDDNKGDLDAHLLPGQGTFDFDKGYRALAEAGYAGYLSAELMMFGDNPVPPRPLDLLRETKAHTERHWPARHG